MARPLNEAQAVTVWVPSLGSRCGIAEYTNHLRDSIAQTEGSGAVVTIVKDPPGRNVHRLLHVQHEYALFDDALLSDQVAAARRAGVPVAVTEHSVIVRQRHPSEIHQDWERLFLTPKHAWEEQADALIALSSDGADLLRSRWPGKAVFHISHACPTWFPPRKTSRGRVIGAFGFLTPWKGFWHLLDVLRAEPGTELIIYSHPGNAQIEQAWAQAITGLPVRWIRAFRPEEEVARDLAVQADILVFWYDQGVFASASGAARLGLATGVPVLTSPTRLFSDLTEVTYQPTELLPGIQRLLTDIGFRQRLTDAARDYCHANNWAYTARRHRAVWNEISA